MPFDDEVERAVDTMKERLYADLERYAETLVADLSASARASREQAADQLTATLATVRAEAAALGKEQGREADKAARDRFVAAVRQMDAARSLTGILDILLNVAAREAGRAAVLLVAGDRLRAWRLAGFDSLATNGERLEVALADSGIVAEAVRANELRIGDHKASPSFAALPSLHECVAAPVAIGGEVVAVLYADTGAPGWVADDAPPRSVAYPDLLETLTRHASRSLEALTAFKTARAVAGYGRSATGADDEAAARRYARLLVSEIKLYHESAVRAGQREHDLGVRLGGEIARARTLYEERVPADVSQRGDYFQDELVKTLADGDASLLEPR